ncbi:hypothetical protein Tco_0643808 [Tanacetum coccineum]
MTTQCCLSERMQHKASFKATVVSSISPTLQLLNMDLFGTYICTKDKIAVGDSEKEDETDQDCFELPIWNSYSSKKRGSPREEEQVFLDDLARLQRQEKEANEEAEALRKKPEQDTENLVTQAETAKSSSTNIFSTVSTTAKASGTNLVNTSGTNPVSTASPKEGLSLSVTTNSQEDDFEIPPLEDIH